MTGATAAGEMAEMAGGFDKKPSKRSELAETLSSCRTAFGCVALFSGMSNVLMLTGAFFMLQVYDRVLPGRSVSTLVALSLLAAGLFLAQGVLDVVRGRILSRIGGLLDEAASGRVFDSIVQLPLKSPARGDGLLPLRDLDAIRTFLSGQGLNALFDLPWIPVYLAIIYSFHPMLGITATVGALVLVGLTVLTEMMTRQPLHRATNAAVARNGLAEASRRNAEVVAAMGMGRHLAARWHDANAAQMVSSQQASDVAGGFGAMSKALRLLLQSAVLGVGAYFVIHGEATAGIIIAGSILVSRALAPVDLAIANWKNFVAARQSWRRLSKLLALMPAERERTALPEPHQSLSLENVGVVPPGDLKSVVHNTSFTLQAGQGLGIIGPSGSGKSSLARALVGVWQPARGRVCLDNAALRQWSPHELGRHIGYLPQDVELFDGTVAENISRFAPDASSEVVIEAAKAAGVHEMIVALPDGYETRLGELGRSLSAGQRQRVALARAHYREPFLLVLDEPNSNLDSEGEAALNHAVRNVRERGGIVIVVAHRRNALAEVDTLLVMANGNTIAFGEKQDVLARTLRAATAEQVPVSVPAPPARALGSQ